MNITMLPVVLFHITLSHTNNMGIRTRLLVHDTPMRRSNNLVIHSTRTMSRSTGPRANMSPSLKTCATPLIPGNPENVTSEKKSTTVSHVALVGHLLTYSTFRFARTRKFSTTRPSKVLSPRGSRCFISPKHLPSR
jgi:hypothetical protein